MGSTPIVEDVAKPRTCGSATALLKEHGAPFVYVRDWQSAPAVLRELKQNVTVRPEAAAAQRARVVAWYRDFLQVMARRFFDAAARLLDDGDVNPLG